MVVVNIYNKKHTIKLFLLIDNKVNLNYHKTYLILNTSPYAMILNALCCNKAYAFNFGLQIANAATVAVT